MKLTDLLVNKKINKFQAPVPRPLPVIPMSSIPEIANTLVYRPWEWVPGPFKHAFDTSMRLINAGESPRSVIQAQLGRYAEPFLDALSKELSNLAGTDVNLNRLPNKELQELAAELVTSKSADEKISEIEERDERLRTLVQEFEEVKNEELPLEIKVERFNNLISRLTEGVKTSLTLPQLSFLREVSGELIKLQGQSSFGEPTEKPDTEMIWLGPGWYVGLWTGEEGDEYYKVALLTTRGPDDYSTVDQMAWEENKDLIGWFNNLEEFKKWGEQHMDPSKTRVLDYSEE